MYIEETVLTNWLNIIVFNAWPSLTMIYIPMPFKKTEVVISPHFHEILERFAGSIVYYQLRFVLRTSLASVFLALVRRRTDLCLENSSEWLNPRWNIMMTSFKTLAFLLCNNITVTFSEKIYLRANMWRSAALSLTSLFAHFTQIIVHYYFISLLHVAV